MVGGDDFNACRKLKPVMNGISIPMKQQSHSGRAMVTAGGTFAATPQTLLFPVSPMATHPLPQPQAAS